MFEDILNKYNFLDIELSKDIISIIIILAISFLSRPIVSKILLGWVRKIVKSTNTKLDDKVLDIMEAPVRFLSIVIAIYLIAEIYVPALKGTAIRTLIATFLFWSLYNATHPLSELLSAKASVLGKSIINWSVKVARVLIILIGVSAVLEIWGIEVAPILAGLGIFGAAVALGMQNLVKNLIAGLLILSERRFVDGDWIRVDGVVEGTVEKIGLRSTLIRRFDKAPVQVPNNELADAPLINFSRMSHRRIHWTIGIEYSATKQQLQQIVSGIEKLISSNDFVPANEISTFVAIEKFNDSSIDIIIYCFTKTTNWGEWLKVKEQLALDIKQLVEQTGTGFAFPSQSIYIEKSGNEPIK